MIHWSMASKHAKGMSLRLGEIAISPPLLLHQFFGGGEAFAAVAVGELGVTEGAGFLYGFHRFETTPAQNLLQCAHHATSLVGEDIERPHRARCRDYHAAFTLVQGLWHGEAVLPHHAIHDAVEKQFECAGHVAPIAWRTHHQCITSLNKGEHTLGIVGRQHAFERTSALHARHARLHAQVLHPYALHLSTLRLALLLNHLKHGGDIAANAWTCIQNQNFHFRIFIINVQM